MTELTLLRRSIVWLRWFWRSLTSMRTALILLFFLALASVPGSLFPQRGTSPLKVTQYLRDHPKAGQILDWLHMFDVFASPWFAAIYLLLFISLAGCVIPRSVEHARDMARKPPIAPRNLSRLPAYTSWKSSVDPVQALTQSAKLLSGKRWRVRVTNEWVSAEKGYLRETGNLVFHMSLLIILLAVGLGGSMGFKGTVLVREGTGFADNVTQFDTFSPGRFFTPEKLSPFSFELKDFAASYQVGGDQNGAARMFRADVALRDTPESTPRDVRIEVNHPLRIQDTTVYLVGHGYSPTFTVRDRGGNVVWQDSAIFLPQDGNFTSTGVIKVPDTVPQLGFQGFFLPTASADATFGPRSEFPAAGRPKVFLLAWTGDLGLDSGVPQSVYRLETKKMKRVGTIAIKPGQGWRLPNGQGTITFDGFKEWASFSITRDPGKGWALTSSILAIIGLSLSLLIPRRRIWLRVSAEPDGTNLYEVAGLSKTEAPGLLDEVGAYAQEFKTLAPEVN